MEKFLKISILILLVVCLGGSFIFFGEKGGSEAVIYINSEVYQRIDFAEVSSPYEIKLPHNTLLIESDGITVTEADCPDKVCIKRGKMKGGAPIVCVPSGLYITVEEGADAVSW